MIVVDSIRLRISELRLYPYLACLKVLTGDHVVFVRFYISLSLCWYSIAKTNIPFYLNTRHDTLNSITEWTNHFRFYTMRPSYTCGTLRTPYLEENHKFLHRGFKFIIHYTKDPFHLPGVFTTKSASFNSSDSTGWFVSALLIWCLFQGIKYTFIHTSLARYSIES